VLRFRRLLCFLRRVLKVARAVEEREARAARLAPLFRCHPDRRRDLLSLCKGAIIVPSSVGGSAFIRSEYRPVHHLTLCRTQEQRMLPQPEVQIASFA